VRPVRVRSAYRVVLRQIDSWKLDRDGAPQVVADCLIDECSGKQWDAIALPGGMPGAEHLRDSAALKELRLHL
jgi:putative intracellular protease/amidase